MVTRNEQEAGYIIVKEFIQRYSAFDNNDDVLGDGNFEDMLFLFFK